METYVQSMGKTQSYNKGDLVNSGWDMTYDGDNLDIGTYSNGEEFYVQLNNAEIMQLLSQPASKQPLEQRLLHDFSHKRHKKSRKRHKTKTKTKTKSSRKHKTRRTKPRQRIQPLPDIAKTIY